MIVVITVALAVVAYTPRRLRKRQRPREHLSALMPTVDCALAADLLGAALLGGSAIPAALQSLHQALAEEGEPNGLDIAGRTLLMGGNWQEAWNDVPERLWPLRDALEPAWIDGAAPLPLLERAAQTIRQTRMRRAREAAGVLGSRLVLPLGLCFLPAFVACGVVPVVASAGLTIFGS
ncbi:hypothetical protein I6E29_08390 [Arcanobacterium haemolyticum]|nr:hypothetical protein [Arcanobacterium haemolyticum]